MDINTLSGYCRSHAINYPFLVDVDSFEHAIVNAVQHSGQRIRFRDMRPSPKNGTKTGWGRR